MGREQHHAADGVQGAAILGDAQLREVKHIVFVGGEKEFEGRSLGQLMGKMARGTE